MRAVWLSLCFLLVVSFSSAQNPQAANPTLGSVSGQVVQDPSGVPIAKVEVSLASANEGVVFWHGQRQKNPLSARTDSEGHFHIEGVPAGDYRVSLQRNGFLPAGRKSQHDSPTSISLAKGEQLHGLFFRVLPAGVIKGRIVDEDGDPLPNVNLTAVTISGRGILGSVITNDLGEYRIAGLAAGKYLVLANGAQAQGNCDQPSNVARIDSGNKRLFAIGSEDDIRTVANARRFLKPLAKYISSCQSGWEKHWSVSIFAGPKFAQYKTELENPNPHETEEWADAYIGEYSSGNQRLVQHPVSSKSKRWIRVSTGEK